ncbi:MAG: 4-phosphoerythronate dehydrogenase [Ignavibacteriae bacterium]|nr:4-phosphoerythronate dehydrogenase [Ignavibacteriota bacterium]
MESDVLFIDQNIPYLADALANCGRVVRFDGRALTNEYLLREHCTILFIRSVTKVCSSLLQNSSVRFVGTATAGTDHIDLGYLNSSGIQFVSAPGSNANAVAEYVLFAMLEWAKRTNTTLDGKSVGIIGYGNVGKLVGKYCYRLGMNILVNDPLLYDNGFSFPEWITYTSIEDLCSQSDIVTNHVPLCANGKYPTLGLLGRRELSKLKTGVLIVHASRGGVIDENSLLKQSENKQLSLAIDVWNNEPIVDMQLAQKAMIATPHIAGYSWNAKFNGARMMAEQFADYSGCSPDYSVMNETNIEFLPKDCTDEATLYQNLSERRQFASDTYSFLQTLNLTQIERASEFDRLRKQYPQRFESLQ